MKWDSVKHNLKQLWYFIWNDDSIWSWIVNIILAFVLIRYIVYPGLGLILGTGFPIVAVVSGSMEHDERFDAWWESSGDYYSNLGITKEEFSTYPFRDGFNKGDIMILYGRDSVEIGDVIVFRATSSEPIIHRVVEKRESLNRTLFFTKGDHNKGQIQHDMNIEEQNVLGEAVFRVPLLGWIKILFVEFVELFR